MFAMKAETMATKTARPIATRAANCRTVSSIQVSLPTGVGHLPDNAKPIQMNSLLQIRDYTSMLAAGITAKWWRESFKFLAFQRMAA
jgi:hypothetical protein